MSRTVIVKTVYQRSSGTRVHEEVLGEAPQDDYRETQVAELLLREYLEKSAMGQQSSVNE